MPNDEGGSQVSQRDSGYERKERDLSHARAMQAVWMNRARKAEAEIADLRAQLERAQSPVGWGDSSTETIREIVDELREVAAQQPAGEMAMALAVSSTDGK